MLKLTFGIWDDSLIEKFQISEKADLFSEDSTRTDENYHQEMIRLKGESHCLVWQFSSILVVVSKFSEGINRSPLYISTNNINIDGLCPEVEVDESLSSEHKCLVYLYQFFDGRISQFVFGMIEFTFEVVMALYPSWQALALFCILIFPERYTQLMLKFDATGLKIDNLKQVFKHLTQNYPVLFALLVLGIGGGLVYGIFTLFLQ